MTDDRWERIRSVFEKALACPPDRRNAALADACGSDRELRAEVESLLAHDARAAPEFLASFPADALTALDVVSGTILGKHDTDSRLGQRIGRYALKSVIGAGGMGAVYVADQDQPRRSVAVKVLRWGLLSPAAVRRFEYESEILARLHHPNIAQVYEAGTHEDSAPGGAVRRPYFVMEYVEGARTLLEFAGQQGLGTRQRLELFTQVCDAVQHGHQKGVIHRDLKPGNVLVGADGRVKVIDFGVARSTDADIAMTTLQTAVGQLIGTLQYMSPEQCDADPHAIDTRSDIYSLGVMLYELLTGQRPYDAAGTVYHATRVIKEQAPRRPSSISRKFRGDLEIIVLKALEKDRDKRYASAADLAQDIRRHLSGAPIEARPPTIPTRLLRWISHHPVLTTAGLCTLVACSMIGGTWGAIVYAGSRPGSLHPVWDSTGPNAVPDRIDLLSIGNTRLHSWDGTVSPILFVTHDLVERPEEFGGGRLALIGFAGARRHYPKHPNSLAGFDVDRSLTEPALNLFVKRGDSLPDLHDRGYQADQFSVCFAGVQDVFDDVVGPEIIVAFKERQGTQSILRIYSLAGEVLYEIWDDGYPTSCWWMSGPRLLVFAGLRGTSTLGELGYTEARDPVTKRSLRLRHPGVIYAIRPQRGDIIHDYLRTTPGTDSRSPVWYFAAVPAASCTLVRVAPPAKDWERSVAVAVDQDFGRDGWGAACWELDEHGQTIPKTLHVTGPLRYPNGKYQDLLPDLTEFRLIPYAELPLDQGLRR